MKYFLISFGGGLYEVAEAACKTDALAFYALHGGLSRIEADKVEEISSNDAAQHAGQGRAVRKAGPRIVKQAYTLLGVAPPAAEEKSS